MNRDADELEGEGPWSGWSELRSQAPWLGAALVPILALAFLGPQVLDPVLVFGAAVVLASSTGSVVSTAMLAFFALAAWMWPVLL